VRVRSASAARAAAVAGSSTDRSLVGVFVQ
jgi:hypothetical protein